MSTNTARTNKKNNAPAARVEATPATDGPTPAAPAPVESAATTEPSAPGPVAYQPEPCPAGADAATWTAMQQIKAIVHSAGPAGADALVWAVGNNLTARAKVEGARSDAAPNADTIRAVLERATYAQMDDAISAVTDARRATIGAALTAATLRGYLPPNDVTGPLVRAVNPFRAAGASEYDPDGEEIRSALLTAYAVADRSGPEVKAMGLPADVTAILPVITAETNAAAKVRAFAVRGADAGFKGLPPVLSLIVRAMEAAALIADSETARAISTRKAITKAGGRAMAAAK
jgi:hypothetical protein